MSRTAIRFLVFLYIVLLSEQLGLPIPEAGQQTDDECEMKMKGREGVNPNTVT